MAYSYNYLPGIQIEWPGGLENIYSFNGLVLNDLHGGPDRYKINKIDGLFDAEVRDSREANPSRHGETAYQSYYGGKAITIEGTIFAGNLTKLRNMIAALQIAFSDLNEYPLYIYNYSGYQTSTPQAYINCKKAAPINIEEANTSRRMIRNFSITLRAADPFVYSTTENTAYIVPTKSTSIGRIYNRVYNLTYNNIAYNLDGIYATNNGTFNKSPKFRIYGAFTNPFIYNYTTSQKILINYSADSGDYIEYDLNNHTLVDSNGVSIISALDISSDDFYLKPGQNSIGFGDPNPDIGTTTLEIKYRDSYI